LSSNSNLNNSKYIKNLKEYLAFIEKGYIEKEKLKNTY